jgi:hypothetical protein
MPAVPQLRAAGATLLALAALASPARGQTETPRLRMEFLELQRAWPFPEIPAGAFQRARQDLVRRFPDRWEPSARKR